MDRTSHFMRGLLTLLPALLIMLIAGGWNSSHAEQNAVEQESAKVWVGKKATPFILPGVEGKPVDIGKDLGKRPIVLVFYRGVW